MSDLLKRLCEAAGPSGSEESAARLILDEIKGYAEYRTDRLGNIIVFKKGEMRARTRLLVCAHMDEVGLIVTSVMEKGFLKFDAVGGIDPRVVDGRRVLIGKDNVPGVVGGKPVHLLNREERNSAPSMEQLYIDIGASSKEDALSLVSPGDTAVFDSGYEEFGDGFVKAKAIDDRAGCALLVRMIQSPQKYDKYFAFTVQEEIGMRGAKTAAYAVKPEAALVVEATTAADIAFTEETDKVCFLGKGPVLSFMDRRTIYDRRLYELAVRLAGRLGIPVQPKIAVADGNDAGSVHLSGEGAKTLAVSLPCRYLHSPSCVIRQSDVRDTLLLLNALSDEIPANPVSFYD